MPTILHFFQLPETYFNNLCKDSRECFAKEQTTDKMLCRVLRDTHYEDGECPFCKPVCNVTKGKEYGV